MAFHSWKSKLPAFLQICSVVLPGRESRLSEELYTDFEDLLAELSLELEPFTERLPFAVFGHSMGSLLAFEWVRSRRRTGAPLPEHLFLSGRPAPDSPIDLSPLADLPDEEFLEGLTSRYQGIPEEFLQNEEIMQLFLPVLRADLAIVESYRFQPEEPLTCPLSLFGGADDRTASYSQLMGWQRQSSGPFRLQLFPGGHFYPQDPLLQIISATLTQVSSCR